jgi:hypothetical protein
MVPRNQHLRHQPIVVAFDRAAQPLQLGRHSLIGGGGITQLGQPSDR